jgi:hypothetical protein
MKNKTLAKKSWSRRQKILESRIRSELEQIFKSVSIGDRATPKSIPEDEKRALIRETAKKVVNEMKSKEFQDYAAGISEGYNGASDNEITQRVLKDLKAGGIEVV